MKRNNKNKKMLTYEKIIKKRSMYLGSLLFILMGCLWGKVAYMSLQDIDSSRAITNSQFINKVNEVLPATRGSILDRNGYELVFSKRVYNVIFDPSNMQKLGKEKVIKLKEIMADMFSIESSKIDEILSNANNKYSSVVKAIDVDKKDELKEKLALAGISGISYEEDAKREYRGGNFASHVLGFATSTNGGRTGLESKYDEYLRGVAGRKYVTLEDGIPSDTIEQARDGASLMLTIDKNIQTFVEEGISKLEFDFNPCKASIVAMEPSTGKVLAMANSPGYDLNDASNTEDVKFTRKFELIMRENQLDTLTEGDKLNSIWRNSAISDTYEPGSIFKPLLVAAAFEENLITEDQLFLCDGGEEVVPGKPRITCMGNHGYLTPKEILKESCNDGVMQIAALLGPEKFYKYQKAFGIGEYTYIDLPGEVSGKNLMHEAKNLGPSELATSSFGQSFNVTPMQMLSSFCAVINGGKLMKPYTVSQIIDDDGGVVYQNNPLELRRVISSDVSEILRKYLFEVVEDGLGKRAKVEGYAIGGKTGTSEKLPRAAKRCVTSIVTFAPINDPKVAIIVSVEEPMTDPSLAYGGVVAGPVSGQIMEKILKYMGVPKYITSDNGIDLNEKITVENYVGMDITGAMKSIKSNHLTPKINGAGSTITSQIPAPGEKLNYNEYVTLNVTSDAENLAIMPLVTELTYEEAIEKITNAGLIVDVDENGMGKKVIKQAPLQGTKFDVGTKVIIEYKK